jgi:hypothetical protein
MPTKVYESTTIELIDGTELYITPLKIKYLKQFMDVFDKMKDAKDEDGVISVLCECVAITMKQFCPIIKTAEDVEDAMDLKTVYKILDISANIKIDNDKKEEQPILEQAESSAHNWDNLDLAKLESELFLLGIWKDYEELETSLSMPELLITLNTKRDLDHQEKKFLAALQGADLDAEDPQSNAWEDMKARVASGGKAQSANDIIAYQGEMAKQHGFGIGMGLEYEDLR